MVLRTRRYGWWLVGAAFLGGFAVAAWFGLRWLAQSEGNSEQAFARLRVGMSQHEAVEVLRTFDASSGRSSQGITTDGREFHTGHYDHPALDDLPPPSEIESCTLRGLDSYGRELEVILGPGGVVASKSLSPGWWEYRWDKAYRSLRDKPYRKLLARHRTSACGLAVALLVISTCRLRYRPRPGQTRSS